MAINQNLSDPDDFCTVVCFHNDNCEFRFIGQINFRFSPIISNIKSISELKNLGFLEFEIGYFQGNESNIPYFAEGPIDI